MEQDTTVKIIPICGAKKKAQRLVSTNVKLHDYCIYI